MIYKFPDLINVNALKQIASNIYLASGIPIGIIGNDDIIYVSAGWQDICTQFHRIHPITEEHCHISDHYIKDHLYTDKYIEYKCLNGLTDIGLPIIINDQHIATVYLGQFFYDDEIIDVDFFRKQSKQYGFDEESYIAALYKVPRISHEKVKYILDYYKGLIITLIESSLLSIENAKILKEVQLREERLNSYFDSIDDLIFVLSENGYFKDYITSHSNTLYLQPDQFIGKSIHEVLPLNVADLLEKSISEIKNGKVFQQFEYPLTFEGSEHWYLARLTHIKKNTNDLNDYIAVVRDITDIKRNEELIKQMAYYDQLTGLYNRSMFYETLSHTIDNAKRTSQQFAVMFLDLDNFKKINDTWGHQIGDILLHKLGGRLKQAIRISDTVARMGGDEFIIITEHFHDLADLIFFIERLLEALYQPFSIENNLINMTFSIGVALYPEDGVNSQDLVKNADIAMYYVKENGKNRYQFFGELILYDL